MRNRLYSYSKTLSYVKQLGVNVSHMFLIFKLSVITDYPVFSQICRHNVITDLRAKYPSLEQHTSLLKYVSLNISYETPALFSIAK